MGRGLPGWSRSRRDAEEQAFEAKRTLWPVTDPPEALVDALFEAARRFPDVRWVTLGEYKGNRETVARLMVGVRRRPGAGDEFGPVEAVFRQAVADAIGARLAVEVVELDMDVDETMADGTQNPYVVVRPAE